MSIRLRRRLPGLAVTGKKNAAARQRVILAVERLEERYTPAVLQVGPTRAFTTVAAAAAAASNGDDIQIDAGLYSGAAAVATFTANNLTIEGVGGQAHLDAT